MKRERSNDATRLLAELMSLRSRFGEDVFSEAMVLLKNREFSDSLSGIVELKRLPPANRSKQRDRGNLPVIRRKALEGDPLPDEVVQYLKIVSREDLRKEKLLRRFAGEYLMGSILEELSDVRHFLGNAGISFKGRSRSAALLKLLDYLAKHSPGEIREIMSRMVSEPAEGDRSLAGWHNVIMHRSNGREST